MKLRDYLAREKLSAAAFAALVRPQGRKEPISRMAVCRYLAGRIPQSDVLIAITEATAGEVAAHDFYPAPRRRRAA